MASDRRSTLSRAERERLEAFRTADGLDDLRALTGTESAHEAYFAAKREWTALRDRALPPTIPTDDLPGDAVEVDGSRFVVHGITHADTAAERTFCRGHVDRFLGEGNAVYCEQGIRPMYFKDVDAVYAMDDYRWALSNADGREGQCGVDEYLSGASAPEFEGVLEDVTSLADRFRETAFSLVHSGADLYGDEFASALGDVASSFLTGHEDVATGTDFESFRRSRRAAENPRLLGELQRYYKTQFLPQPLERAWLCRHDPELEAVSHARNERMADYAVFHGGDADTVRLVVGAAHQPGVVYYLQQHRDGHRDVEGFELVE